VRAVNGFKGAGNASLRGRSRRPDYRDRPTHNLHRPRREGQTDNAKGPARTPERRPHKCSFLTGFYLSQFLAFVRSVALAGWQRTDHALRRGCIVGPCATTLLRSFTHEPLRGDGSLAGGAGSAGGALVCVPGCLLECCYSPPSRRPVRDRLATVHALAVSVFPREPGAPRSALKQRREANQARPTAVNSLDRVRRSRASSPR